MLKGRPAEASDEASRTPGGEQSGHLPSFALDAISFEWLFVFLRYRRGCGPGIR